MQFAPGVRRYALPPVLAAIVAAVASPALALGFVALAGFVCWFFRDPDRTRPPRGIVSPADGRVSLIRREDDRIRVGVFMNVSDVHVNRAPIGGSVDSVRHEPGGHLPAFSKSAERNERTHFAIGDVDVTLIAGTIARRITPYVDDGDAVGRGDRIGHIAFGSRADVLLPASVDRDDVAVERGERVRAGETVVARVDGRPTDTADDGPGRREPTTDGT
ncbi:phosphatidylserine decarboxylase family protein [Halobacteriales archaeon SW_7_68_16]|nr:MAG: phosphatidylserine decarboxylase family protein [Halobacteriales archaeon SW_7_68_16]